MAIKYDDNYVKQPLAPVEYTPEMLQELKRCSEDIQHFLKYVKIVHPDKGRIDFEPYDFQRKILQTVKDNRFAVILCSRQAGKCVQSDTKITVKNKKTGFVETASIGDFYNMAK